MTDEEGKRPTVRITWSVLFGDIAKWTKISAIAGFVMLGFGLYGIFDVNAVLLKEPIDFTEYSGVFVWIGALLLLPLYIHLVAGFRKARNE